MKWFVVFLILMLSLGAGYLYTETSSISANFELARDVTLDYINLLYTIADWAKLDALKSMLLLSAGVEKMKTSKTLENCTSCKIMKESWESARNAKRLVYSNPDKSKKELEKALDYASDAFLIEMLELTKKIKEADEIGLDKIDEPTYEGKQSFEVYKQVKDMETEICEMANKYSAEELNRKTEFIKEVMELDPANGIKKLGGILDLSYYYNFIAAPGGIYSQTLESRKRLEEAIEETKERWEISTENYQSIVVNVPKQNLTSEDMNGLADTEEEPSKYISKGKALLKKADLYFSIGMEIEKEKSDDYLVNAINKVREAIRLKNEASSLFERASQIEAEWALQIREICETEYTPKTEISYLYYQEGKKICDSGFESSNLRDAAYGARLIKNAVEIDNNPEDYRARMYKELEDMASDLYHLIQKAKMDGIECSSEEQVLNDYQRSKSDIMNYISSMEIWKRRLGYAKESLVDKIKESYGVLEEYYNEYGDIGVGGVFTNGTIDIENGIGKLKEVKERYEKLMSEAEPDVSLKTITTGVCNELMDYQYEINIRNPYPVGINGRMVEIEDLKFWLDEITAYETKTVMLNVKEIGVTCDILNEKKDEKKTIYSIKIKPKHRMDVLIPIKGRLVNENAFMKGTNDGILIRDISKEETITIAVENSAPQTNITLPKQNYSEYKVLNKTVLESDVIELDRDMETKDNAIDEKIAMIKRAGKCHVYYGDIKSVKSYEEADDIYNRMLRDAIEKVNILRLNGLDDKADEAMTLIEKGKLCDIINMEVPEPKSVETANITGLTAMDLSFVPVISIIILAYLAFKGGEKKVDRVKRILKRFE